MRRRGADPDDILDFRVSFPGAAVGAEWRGDELPAAWGHSCCILIGDAPQLVLYVFFKDTLLVLFLCQIGTTNLQISSQLSDVLKLYEMRWLLKQLWPGRYFGDLRVLFKTLIKSGSVYLNDQTNVLAYKIQISCVLVCTKSCYFVLFSVSASLKSVYGQQMKICLLRNL